MDYKKELVRIKREDIALYNTIMEKYEPIFDKYVAVEYWHKGIEPPLCQCCNQRLEVRKNQNTLCKACLFADKQISYEGIKDILKERNVTTQSWIGLIKKSNKLTFTCTKHNHTYKQVLNSFLSGYNGCKECQKEHKASKLHFPKDSWIDKAISIHNNKYDYSLAGDVHRHNDKIKIICPDHGEYEQMLYLHLNGHRCTKCGLEHGAKSAFSAYTTDAFIDRANEIHDGKYDYSKAVYTKMPNNLTITCARHGDFVVTAGQHIFNKTGCPKCGRLITNISNVSKPEQEVYEYVKSLCPDAVQSCRDILNNDKELDIYVPSKKLAIEFDGIYWHSSRSRDTDDEKSKYHLLKTEDCESKGIHLLHIFCNEWNERQDVWKSVIKQKLGLTDKKIYARKCHAAKVDNKAAISFFNLNHLQGNASAKYYVGLFHEGSLVACMSFAGTRYTEGDFEILRYANIINHSVVGGFSKLLKFFMRDKSGKVVSYANRRWSNGNVYESNKFTLANISGPCYYYTKDYINLQHRSVYMKHKLSSKLDTYDPNKTEVENMYENGYGRIWDCGNKVYIRIFE